MVTHYQERGKQVCELDHEHASSAKWIQSTALDHDEYLGIGLPCSNILFAAVVRAGYV